MFRVNKKDTRPHWRRSGVYSPNSERIHTRVAAVGFDLGFNCLVFSWPRTMY